MIRALSLSLGSGGKGCQRYYACLNQLGTRQPQESWGLGKNQIFQKGFEPGEKERVDVTMIRDGRHKKRRWFGCKIKAMVTSPGPYTQEPSRD